MTPFYALRVEDLIRPLAVVVITCRACQAVYRVNPIKLVVRPLIGPNASVRHLDRQCVCPRCGIRGHAHVELEWL